ncbi:MAG: helix-turn-helix domain-containing protein [Bacteroidota bacterium]|jgi:DNA-binding NtrC family response regulator
MDIESSLVGKSSQIQELRKDITRFGKLDRHILLIGERGTGKATAARLIHQQSGAKGIFFVLDPHTSTETEVKEALEQKQARISTLFIRDVDEFSFVLQAEMQKALRQLPKKPFTRIIASIGKSLGETSAQQKLIESLSQVLAEFETIQVPHLRERQEDIPLLVEHFIKRACDSIGVQLKAIDINALDFLTRREWKENVTELKSTIERAVLTSDEQVIELPEYVRDEQAQLQGILGFIRGRRPFSFDKSLANLERTLIERALEASGYNQTRAARILNLSEANLRYRLKKFHLTPKNAK